MDSAYSLVLMEPVTERNKSNYSLFELCILHLYQTRKFNQTCKLDCSEKSREALYKVLHAEEQQALFGEFRLYSDDGLLLFKESSQGEIFVYNENGEATLHLEVKQENDRLLPGSDIVHELCPRYKDGEQVLLQKMFIFSSQGSLQALIFTLEGQVLLNYVPYGFCFVLSGEKRISFRDRFANMLYHKSMNEIDYYP